MLQTKGSFGGLVAIVALIGPIAGVAVGAIVPEQKPTSSSQIETSDESLTADKSRPVEPVVKETPHVN
ncbi:hypothetical protein [Alteromonas antoniana]|uniref:hypothetical protein n=1 Tax=Alteromonas antoniana TaxID=2803813 RepID=UPI001C462EF7|nr:hypothetical protein [Alteromonas antoniana]